MFSCDACSLNRIKLTCYVTLMIKINYFVRYSQLFLWFAKADNPTCKLLHDYVCTVDKLANNKIVGFER